MTIEEFKVFVEELDNEKLCIIEHICNKEIRKRLRVV